MSTTKDLLIVGQGIAGSLLGWHAEKVGLTFNIIDPDSTCNASSVSSGIINPVTGPKYVKSWMIDQFLPYAKDIYQEISLELNELIIYPTPLYHHLPDPKSENLWESRVIDPAYETHVAGAKKYKELEDLFRDVNKFGLVSSAHRIDVARLIKLLRCRWIASNVLLPINFRPEEFNIDRPYEYGGKTYRNVVMATGYSGINDKYFMTNAYRPIKGEVLICKIQSGPKNKVVKRGKFLVPLDGDLYWIGSNYDPGFKNTDPDKDAIAPLIVFLEEELQLDYEIVDHLSGVRPATKYRRPLVGEHPNHQGLYILNGLGTKGISIAPWFSQQVIEAISTGSSLQPTEAFRKSFIM